jgi:hypothetical protein
MGTGALAHLAISRQNSFGTATGSWFFAPFVSESLIHAIDLIAKEGIRASLVEPGILQGMERAEGDIVLEPHPLEIGHFLRGVFGQASSSVLGSVAALNNFTHTFDFRLADFDSKTPLPPYTLEIYRSVEEAFQFADTIFPRMELIVEHNALVRATFGALTRTVSLKIKETAVYRQADEWSWAVASLGIGGVAVDVVESLTIAVENPTEGIGILNASRRWARFGRTGFPNVRLSGTIDLADLSEYDTMVAGTERRLVLHLAPMVQSGPYLTVDIPAFRYEGFPVAIGGPGRVTVDFTGRGPLHQGSNTAIRISLVNTVANYQ